MKLTFLATSEIRWPGTKIHACVYVCMSSAAPSAPRNFSLSPIADNPRELQADWTIPFDTNGVIQSYTVMCNNSEVFVVEGSEAEMISSTLDGNFDPFTVYECSVSAATNGGVGDASETAVARTEQDGYSDTIAILYDNQLVYGLLESYSTQSHKYNF